MKKRGFIAPTIATAIPPTNQLPAWLLEQVRQMDIALRRFQDVDRHFANDYNSIASGAVCRFAGRGTNGACTLGYTGNVASVTRTGAGVYAVVFTEMMADANYSPRAVAEYVASAGVLFSVSAKTAAGFTFSFFNLAGAAADPGADVHVDVKGNAS